MATRKDTKTAFAVLENHKERVLQRMKELRIDRDYQPLVVDVFSASVENINYGDSLTIPWIQVFVPPLFRNEFLNLLESNKKLKTKVKEDKPEKAIDRLKRMVVVANCKKKKKKP